MSEPNNGTNDNATNDNATNDNATNDNATNDNATNDGAASDGAMDDGAANGIQASEAAGKRRGGGAVRMTAFAPYAAKRAVALEPGGPTAVRIEAGRRAVRAASGQAAHLARTVWAAVALRKAAAVGAGVGLTVLSLGSYALGRRTERQAHGPLTRLTRGRF